MARIAILGTPLLEADLPFPIYNHEWPIVTREIGTKGPDLITASVPSGDQSASATRPNRATAEVMGRRGGPVPSGRR
ncbi:hypothetical protein ABH930_007410 [Kitasatospora sp. GAS204A]|nr:hypothetical protein [Kitasatospora sp. GAS204B]